MFFSNVTQFSSKLWSKGVLRLKQPLICLTLSLSLAASGFPTLSASAAEAPNLKELGRPSTANFQSPMPDGVYVYGQSPEPGQIGATYLVFEVSNQQTVGAFYLPSSSFDCFHGELQPNRLLLTVVDSYDQTTHPYAVALQTKHPLTASNLGKTPPVGLIGFHPVRSISDMDYQLLSTCQANYRQQIEL
ncbi:MAG: hypothetical protein QNJ46_35620 [Leptolyngbyaceae cyanobacterium MO_188.B28]|nr:hypothetical protein [Leptolyngbyaceae cyanobacterium MO_188.B28]